MRVTPLGWKVAVIFTILVVAAILIGRGHTSSSEHLCAGSLLGRPLRVGIVTWPGYAGGIVANNGFPPNADSIFYRKHHLCVEFMLMEDVDVRAKAFPNGGKDGVDIVWSTVDSWAHELPGLLRNNVRAKAIMQVDWSRGGDAIVADKSIKSIEDLYQKKISLALFTPSHWLLEYSLESSGLDKDKQEDIVRSLIGKNASPDARADFVAGKVDAAVVWEPDVAAALQGRHASHPLVSSREARKLIADIMVARVDFISAHPNVVQAFIEGWIVDGTEEAYRHPEAAARLLMENEPIYQDLGPETTQKSLATVRWANLADNAEMFNLDDKDEEPLFDSIFNAATKSWKDRRYITSPVAPAEAKDESFLREIYQRSPGPVERIPDELPQPSPEVTTKPAILVKPITVNFASGDATLGEAAKKVIDDQIALLPKTFSGAYIRVEGNTDNTGDPDHNRALSRDRAQAVVDYLVSKYGLPANQFIAIGNGPDKPIAPNNTEESKRRNRRTDISIVTPR